MGIFGVLLTGGIEVNHLQSTTWEKTCAATWGVPRRCCLARGRVFFSPTLSRWLRSTDHTLPMWYGFWRRWREQEGIGYRGKFCDAYFYCRCIHWYHSIVRHISFSNCVSTKQQSHRSVSASPSRHDTPPKFNMEPENDGFQVRNLHFQWLIFRFMLKLQGCMFQY